MCWESLTEMMITMFATEGDLNKNDKQYVKLAAAGPKSQIKRMIPYATSRSVVVKTSILKMYINAIVVL